MSIFNRRQFLQTIVLTAASTTLIGCSDDDDNSLTLQDGRALFPQGVASGDPKPNSLIFWTRVVDPALAGADTKVLLQISRNENFSDFILDQEVTALAIHDHCLRVKVKNLSPYTTYYYRFIRVNGDRGLVSPIGRSKTAPEASSNVPVRFAFASCQDYIGRYYNTYEMLLRYAESNDIDFIVHLGDYIYETTGDPGFQTITQDRTIAFKNPSQELEIAKDVFAAKSLEGYRTLYRAYRADPVMQKIHARFPMIITWDDHEFSDDCYGNTATYFDEKRNEQDLTRRQNAERAWLEYVPIDDQSVNANVLNILSTASDKLYPNAKIYRNFRYGKNCELQLLDLRSFRSDHLIPEDAFPATIVLNQTELTLAFGPAFPQFAANFAPYINFNALNALQKGTLQAVVTGFYSGVDQATAAAQAQRVLTGDLDANFLNQLFAAANASALAIDTADLPRGMSYFLLGKTTGFDSVGSRYLVVQASYDLYVQLNALLQKRANRLLDTQQRLVLETNLRQSDATWKIVGNSISSTSMVLDLTVDPATLQNPDARLALTVIQNTPALQVLAQRFYLNVDQWDGFPTERAELMEIYSQVGNVILLAGDIHSSFVTSHSNKVFEFTGTSITSSTFQSILKSQINGTSLKDIPGITGLIDELPNLLLREPGIPGQNAIQQKIEYVNTQDNGIVVMTLTANSAEAEYLLLPESEVFKKRYGEGAALLNAATRKRFRITNGQLTAL
jgi:alkaline phosphatase D